MPKLESSEQDSRDIATDLKMIISNSDKINQIVKRLTLEEWRDFIGAYIDEQTTGAVLNKKVVGQKLDEYDSRRPFSTLFREGKRYCAFVMPCDLNGNALEKEDQTDGDYLSLIELPSDEDSQKGAGKMYKLLHDFLPEEIARDCTFEVGHYQVSPDGDDDGAHKERAGVLAKCAQAFIRMRGHYNGQNHPQN